VSCFIREPEFVGQTKDRLATAEAARLVEGAVRDHFDNWLAADPKSAGAILDFPRAAAEERLRRRPRRRRSARPPPRSCACPASWSIARPPAREGTELFIVEGDSAGGSAKMARDRKTQALLPLRGKILNVLGAASGKMGQNAEISDLCQALGVGMGTKFNLDDLRYEKIIIMTDADVDGAHIAALLMTFFFTQMRPLIDQGHLYLACPPLFRLTQGAAVYARDEAEKARWLAEGPGRQGQDRRQPLQGSGRDGRQGPEGNHDGPRDAQADPGVHRRGRAGRDRRSGRAADGQEAGTAVPVHSGERAVRRGDRSDVGTPLPISTSLVSRINEEFRDFGWYMSVNAIIEKSTFWQAVEQYQGQITRAEFTYVTPNVLGIRNKISERLKEYRRNTNAQEVSVAVVEPTGNLKFDSDEMRDSVDYIAEGGGSARLKVGREKVYDSKNSLKSRDVETDDTLMIETPEGRQQLSSKFF
jgi:hypothetical protein